MRAQRGRQSDSRSPGGAGTRRSGHEHPGSGVASGSLPVLRGTGKDRDEEWSDEGTPRGTTDFSSLNLEETAL